MRHIVLILALLAGCEGGAAQVAGSNQNESDAADFWRWHIEKMDVDQAVLEAINEPEGGDYAKAVAITRASNFPPAIKELDIGQLIIGGITRQSSKPAAETLEQGLQLIESAATRAGETSKVAPQQLRMLFERGDGQPPNNIPVDPVIADCWRQIENGKASDPNRCIALRRERLPRVGR